MCDIDDDALRRTRDETYPRRYGNWENAITLSTVDDAPLRNFDLIVVGTPPDVHVDIALNAIAESPKAVLVEKPVCRPDLAGAQKLADACTDAGVRGFVGYDHVVSDSVSAITALLGDGALAEVQTIDVEFREHWGGMLAAHPWLDGPQDSYLGFWRRGGGASGEHSHAANLWQHLARAAGVGEAVEVSASLDYINDGTAEYDRLCLMSLRTESGLLGRVVQDVITAPPRKWLRVQGSEGAVEWTGSATRDVVTRITPDGEATEQVFGKTRPDDFITELTHIDQALSDGTPSPIDLEHGLDTMLIVAAAHLSAESGRTVAIDREQGYTSKALSH